MTCFRPLEGYRSRTVNQNGKRPIVFKLVDALNDRPVKVPCGQCIGCRLEKSRQWAMRCMHEASLYEDNCFLTLTYDDEHLPKDLSLDVREFQLFMKRFRFECGAGIRFFHCGEYGERYGRPHYHAIIFNYDFPDKVLFKRSNGFALYTSDILSRLWSNGYAVIGDVTFDSAAYVARYVMKKVTGEASDEHYKVIVDGQEFNKRPEYTTMSRRPGIGKGWFDKYWRDVYRGDFVVVDGVKMLPPKFYDSQFEAIDPTVFGRIKRRRVVAADKVRSNNTSGRHRVRETVKASRISLLKRSLDAEV